MNAIAYAQYQLVGGHRKLARWVIGFAVLTVLGIVVWTRTSGTLAVAASASRVPLAVTLGVLLVIIANARIAGAIKRDNLLDMSRSHRLMPQPASAAIVGYIIGPSLPVLAAAGVIVVAGVILTLVGGGNPAAWLMVCGVLVVFAAMTWCLTAASSFGTKSARGEKPRGGGIGWVPWVIIGPSLGTGGALLIVVPWLAVILSPLFGQTVFAIKRVDQVTWAHAAAGGLQAGFAVIFFAAACRRYRRDDVSSFSPQLWLGIVLLIVVGSVIGIMRFDEFRPAIFQEARLILNVAVPATLTLLLLVLAAPLAAAESETTRWRYRQNAGDPLADESRPRLGSVATLLLVVLAATPLAIFSPDTEGIWQYLEAVEVNPLALLDRTIWVRAWSLTGAAFVCGAVLIWSVVRIGSRAGIGRYLVFLVLLLWLAPLVAAGVWAFREDGHLQQLLNPLASFSTLGTIWTAWCGTSPQTDNIWVDSHVMTAPAPMLWPGVAFQGVVALAAVVAALRVPNRYARPATRD
jgi:hypothetical protein